MTGCGFNVASSHRIGSSSKENPRQAAGVFFLAKTEARFQRENKSLTAICHLQPVIYP
jgi:hypothetical protein